MVAVRASAGGFDALKWPAVSAGFWNFEKIESRGTFSREVSNASDVVPPSTGPWVKNSDDPEKLARTDPAEQAPGNCGPRCDPFCDAGRRTARARFRPDARQRASPHPALLAPGRGRAVGAHRRRAA